MANVPLTDRTIWLTGASTGIGRSLAEELIRLDNRLIVTSRNAEPLEELKQLAPDRVSVVTADIASPSSVEQMRNGLHSVTERIDTVILNAGTCEYVDVERFESDLFDRVMQVNFVGVARCIEASLELLRASTRQPHIVGIASAAALTGLPRAEAYGASKAGLVSLLESLALDLSPLGIEVSIVYPGFVDTPLTRKNDFPMPFLMTAEEATSLMIDGIKKRRFRIAFPRRLIWSLKLMGILPDWLRHRLGVSMVRST